MTLVEKIRLECKKRKMSLAALERECGFGNGSIRKWDTSPTSHERLAKVAAVLGISVSDLFEEPTENEKIPTETTMGEGKKALIDLCSTLNEDEAESMLKLIEVALAAVRNNKNG